jgi:hypothetical protein
LLALVFFAGEELLMASGGWSSAAHRRHLRLYPSLQGQAGARRDGRQTIPTESAYGAADVRENLLEDGTKISMSSDTMVKSDAHEGRGCRGSISCSFCDAILIVAVNNDNY